MTRYKKISTTLFVALSLLVFAVLPEGQSAAAPMQSIIAGIIFFLVLPLMYCKIILREPLSVLGFRQVRWLPALFWGGVMVVGSGILERAISSQASVWTMSQLPDFAERSFTGFIAYEVLAVGGVTLLYEVFFRGLVMRVWLGSFGAWAIVWQAVIFIGFTWLTGGVSWQYALFFYVSFFSGAIAYFSGSLYASWLISWCFFFLIDSALLFQNSLYYRIN